MKKIIAFVLVLCSICMLAGCSGKMTSAENFLLAVKKMDFSAMKNELVPDDKIGSLYSKLDSDLGEESLLTLRNLYALTQYTIEEISEESGGEQSVKILLKVPDIEKICDHTRVQAMVSADSAEKIVGDMIANGSVAKTMMVEETFFIKMKKEDGVWKIPYADAENKAFAKALAIENMIDFFIKY
ncbi:MAG: hypothetical protein IJA86_00350 [Clostridia bacterium]|nr:hypothetical protein [Clostridia bacterium]